MLSCISARFIYLFYFIFKYCCFVLARVQVDDKKKKVGSWALMFEKRPYAPTKRTCGFSSGGTQPATLQTGLTSQTFFYKLNLLSAKSNRGEKSGLCHSTVSTTHSICFWNPSDAVLSASSLPCHSLLLKSKLLSCVGQKTPGNHRDIPPRPFF